MRSFETKLLNWKQQLKGEPRKCTAQWYYHEHRFQVNWSLWAIQFGSKELQFCGGNAYGIADRKSRDYANDSKRTK